VRYKISIAMRTLEELNVGAKVVRLSVYPSVILTQVLDRISADQSIFIVQSKSLKQLTG
jgi:hypothetical protein